MNFVENLITFFLEFPQSNWHWHSSDKLYKNHPCNFVAFLEYLLIIICVFKNRLKHSIFQSWRQFEALLLSNGPGWSLKAFWIIVLNMILQTQICKFIHTYVPFKILVYFNNCIVFRLVVCMYLILLNSRNIKMG